MSKVIFEKKLMYAAEYRDSVELPWGAATFYESESEAVEAAERSVWRYARVVYLGDNKEEK